MLFGDDHNPQPAGLMLASKVHHASVLFGVHGQGLDMEEAYPEGPYVLYYHYGTRSQKTIPIMVFGT